MTNNIAINSPIESVVKDGRHFLLYTLHKTSLSSGRIVCWPIHDDIWNEFEELRVGEGESYVTRQGRSLTFFHVYLPDELREQGLLHWNALLDAVQPL